MRMGMGMCMGLLAGGLRLSWQAGAALPTRCFARVPRGPVASLLPLHPSFSSPRPALSLSLSRLVSSLFFSSHLSPGERIARQAFQFLRYHSALADPAVHAEIHRALAAQRTLIVQMARDRMAL